MLARILNSKSFIRSMIIANILMLAFLIFLRIMKEYQKNTYSIKVPSNSQEYSIPASQSLKMAFTGSISSDPYILEKAQISPGIYDFSPFLDDISSIINDADWASGNLETVFAGTENEISYSGVTPVNAPDNLAVSLKDAGFDFLATGNTHACDHDVNGIVRTLSILDKYELKHTGTFTEWSEARNIPVHTVNGIRFSILSYAENSAKESAIAKTFRLNRIKKLAIRRDIQQAKKEGAEVVIIYFDFDEINGNSPTYFQKDIATFSIENGADIIIGSIPDKIFEIECVETTNPYTEQGLIAYSLGSFLATNENPYSNQGVVLQVSLQKDQRTQTIQIGDVSMVPVSIPLVTMASTSAPTIVPVTSKALYNGKLDSVYTQTQILDMQTFYERMKRLTEQSENSCLELYPGI
ncbi:MAG: CapA family protein [Bacteroidota bacterium]